jgi:hypothetical protein
LNRNLILLKAVALLRVSHFFRHLIFSMTGSAALMAMRAAAGFVFPLRFELNGELNMRGMIGVCREVCVPMEVAQKLVFNRDGLAASPHRGAIKDLIAGATTRTL